MSEIETKILTKTLTLTLEELWRDVKSVEIYGLSGCLPDYLDGIIEEGFFRTFYNMKGNLDLQIEVWQDCCADNFFKDNLDINDVLVETERSVSAGGKIVISKKWIASR